MSTQLPKPGNLLLACALAVIFGGTLLIARLIAENFTWTSWGSVFGGLFLIPTLLALVWTQFRGVFRSDQGAATVAALILMCIAGLLSLLSVVGLVEIISSGFSLDAEWPSLISVFGTLLMIAVFHAVSGWQNWRWSRDLKAAPVEREAIRATNYSLVELMVGVTSVATLVGMTAYWIRTAPPTMAEHVEASASPFSLPTDASDVSYARTSGSYVAYEFTCSEAAFREWWHESIGSLESRDSGVELREIEGVYEMSRYTSLGPNPPPGLGIQPTAVIHDGLYYTWLKEDRGLYGAYDRSTGRGYYLSHSR